MTKGQIEILDPIIADSAVDSRGIIYTYVPEQDIKEFNYVVTNVGSTRGYHYHEEFDEFIMLVEGEMLVLEFLDNDACRKLILGPGQTIKIPKSTKHAFVPVTNCKFISFCTKPWDLCNNPITKI